MIEMTFFVRVFKYLEGGLKHELTIVKESMIIRSDLKMFVSTKTCTVTHIVITITKISSEQSCAYYCIVNINMYETKGNTLCN